MIDFMVRNYIIRGLNILMDSIVLALIIFVIFTLVKFIVKRIMHKKIKMNFIKMICEFLWIWTVISILKITNIIGGNFGVSSLSYCAISFSLFDEGLNAAMLLNIILFIPFGFLSATVIKNSYKYWWLGIILGFVFSTLIEFLQMFVGRYAQLSDVVMNTGGTFIGYLIGICLIKLIIKTTEKETNK